MTAVLYHTNGFVPQSRAMKG